jgi:hypothetical protein
MVHLTTEARRPPARTGRSALAWGAASFVLMQLGLALAIERWLPELRDPSYAVKARVLGRRTGVANRAAAIVMVGSSRVEYGLLGQALEEQLQAMCSRRPVVFNFGISGAGPVTELLTVRRLLADGIRPDLLLIEVLPPCLAGQLPSSELTRLTSDRLRLDDLPLVARYGPPLAELRADWWQGWPVPWYSHRYAILARSAPQFLPGRVPSGAFDQIDESGSPPLPESAPTPDAYRRGLEQARTAYAPCFAGFELGGPACAALQELLELCQHEQIAAALVLMPEGQDFRDLYPSAAWAQIEQFLGALSRRYCAPVIDARDWVPDAHFSDGHHLLRPGAALFTERLAREHLGPFLAVTHGREN